MTNTALQPRRAKRPRLFHPCRTCNATGVVPLRPELEETYYFVHERREAIVGDVQSRFHIEHSTASMRLLTLVKEGFLMRSAEGPKGQFIYRIVKSRDPLAA